jgi:hypothetical protein
MGARVFQWPPVQGMLWTKPACSAVRKRMSALSRIVGEKGSAESRVEIWMVQLR